MLETASSKRRGLKSVDYDGIQCYSYGCKDLSFEGVRKDAALNKPSFYE